MLLHQVYFCCLLYLTCRVADSGDGFDRRYRKEKVFHKIYHKVDTVPYSFALSVAKG